MSESTGRSTFHDPQFADEFGPWLADAMRSKTFRRHYRRAGRINAQHSSDGPVAVKASKRQHAPTKRGGGRPW